MQPTSVQDAKLNKINIQVKSSFVSKSGTLINGLKKNLSNQCNGTKHRNYKKIRNLHRKS